MLVAEYRVSEIVPGTTLLRVLGEVDECVIAEFRAAVAAAERGTTCGMIVELDDARIWSTAAYSIVIAAAARLGLTGSGPLIVVCRNGHLASRVFRALHFGHRCVETTVAAIAALRCNGTSVAVTYAERFLRAAVS